MVRWCGNRIDSINAAKEANDSWAVFKLGLKLSSTEEARCILTSKMLLENIINNTNGE
jgi:hypothetical protein